MLFGAALVFTSCSNGRGAGSGGGGGTPIPPGSFAVAFGVDGGNGTLKAKAEGGTETNVSPLTVEAGKTVTFTAMPNANFAVEKWMNGDTVIAEAGADTTYTLTVTAAANIKAKFKSTYTGPALALNTAEFTKEMGTNFTYKLVTAGSGSYTAVPENPGIITLNMAQLNSYGNITVT